MATKELLFIHHQSHIGGGQTYLSALYSESLNQGYVSTLVENKNSWQLVKILFTTKSSDVVWGIYSDFPLFPYFLSWLLGKKNHLLTFGIWMQEMYPFADDKSAPRIQLRKILFVYEKYILQLTFALLSSSIAHLSEYGKKLFLSKYPKITFFVKSLPIIFGGADTTLFRPKPNKEKLRRKLGLTKALAILMVGRIDSRKNYTQAIEVISTLKKMNTIEVQLVFIFSTGRHNRHNYIAHLAECIRSHHLGSQVRILVGLSRQEMAEYYQAADILLMLSKKLETFGLVTLEALQSGCLVFGYDACATPEILGIQRSPFLAKVLTPRAVAEKIDHFLKLPTYKKRAIEKQLQISIRKFNWKKSFLILQRSFTQTV